MNRICELGANPVPLTVKVKVTEPATTLEGESEEMLGVGRLMTPPQDATTVALASKTPNKNFEQRFKSFSPARVCAGPGRLRHACATRKTTKDDEMGQLGCPAAMGSPHPILPRPGHRTFGRKDREGCRQQDLLWRRETGTVLAAWPFLILRNFGPRKRRVIPFFVFIPWLFAA